MKWPRLWRSNDKRGAVLTPDLRHEIGLSFDAAARDEEHFPSTIDPRILHVQLLLETFGDLNGKRVLDAGCGKGRFARVLLERFAGAEIYGVDVSLEMLRFLPDRARGCAAFMTELPFADASFDALYATESLEHAVEIERAVEELCRVLRPGGWLVIIDKNIQHAGRLKTAAWERWFGRRELEKLLKRHCAQVSSRELSYWADVPADGLFLAWVARK